jgi:signal transduction histidine kinase
MTPNEALKQGDILVVDDNRINRLKLRHMLEEQGHVVAMAQNGLEALDLLRTQPFDVVLLDLLMPEMDGFQTLQAIKTDQALRSVVVIVISALDEMESVVRCIEMGAEDYLPKPFDPVLLHARLKNSLEKKKMRDLEQIYLQQELMLRQSEKLATLGKLSAGVAHELNNPAAAAQRCAGYLPDAITRLLEVQHQLHAFHFSGAQETTLSVLSQRVLAQVDRPRIVDSLTRSDYEEEVETWLQRNGVKAGWEVAGDLVSLGFTPDELAALGDVFGEKMLPAVVRWTAALLTVYSLAREIGDTTARISEIISALRSYTYMDQAPMQQVDIHRGLEDTLTMLRHKLKGGVVVQRDYASDLPRIDAYGSELNQVWTNLIDNAIAAMGGNGQLRLRTRREGGWVIVGVQDNGHGIPEAIQPKIFDPFFTTKPPGEGTGLGLSIAHHIVVNKHKGQLCVYSQPGETSFEVCLPIEQ